MSVQLEELLHSVRDVFGEFFTIDRQKTAPEPHFLIQRTVIRCWHTPLLLNVAGGLLLNLHMNLGRLSVRLQYVAHTWGLAGS